MAAGRRRFRLVDCRVMETKIKTPSGKVITVKHPDGASKAEILAYAQKNYGQAEPPKDWAANEMSGAKQFAAGAGKAITDIGRGIGQMTGMVSDQSINDAKALDQPLMQTGAGTAGNLAGGIAAFAPTAFIPGANTYAGAALVGGAMGALQPVAEGESRGVNIAAGTAGGLVGQAIGNAAGKGISKLTAKKSQNALKDAVLKESLDAGYVIPKSDVSPTFVSNRMEGIAGKAALRQDATIRNQSTTNSLARKVLGLSDDQPISLDVIKKYQDDVSEPYRQVAALNKKAPGILEKLKETRNEAQSYWKHYNQSADPKSLKAAKRLDADALNLEDKIEAIAIEKGSPALLKQLQQSRKLLAQSYDIKRALNPATGDVNAQVLGKMLDKGKPLSGELKTIANFSKAFSKFAGEGSKAQAPGVSKLEALVGLGLAGGGAGLMGPEGAALGGLALLSPVTRNAMLSKGFQKAFVPANYAPLTLRALNSPAVKAGMRLAAPAGLISAGQQ